MLSKASSVDMMGGEARKEIVDGVAIDRSSMPPRSSSPPGPHRGQGFRTTGGEGMTGFVYINVERLV